MSRRETLLVDVVAYCGGVPGAPGAVPVFQLVGLPLGEMWVAQTDRGDWQTLGQMRGIRARLPERLAVELRQIVGAAWPGLVR